MLLPMVFVNEGFFTIILHASDNESYDKYLPDVEQMIKSFKIISMILSLTKKIEKTKSAPFFIFLHIVNS